MGPLESERRLERQTGQQDEEDDRVGEPDRLSAQELADDGTDHREGDHMADRDSLHQRGRNGGQSQQRYETGNARLNHR